MPPDASPKLVRRLFAILNQASMPSRDDRLLLMSWILWRTVGSTNELHEVEIDGITQTLAHWQRQGELESRCRTAADEWRARAGIVGSSPSDAPHP